MVIRTVTHSPNFSARLRLVGSTHADHFPRLRSRRLLAGGLGLAATRGCSIGQRHVGERRTDTSLKRDGFGRPRPDRGTRQAAGPATALQADKSADPFFQPAPDRLCREWATDRPDASGRPFAVDAVQVPFFAGISRDF
jgi:hypothetical protein